MLQQRSLNILEMIMGNNNITIKDLEINTLLTRRQINYDLNSINDWLIKNNFKEIIKHKKEGFIFVNDTNDVLKILSKDNMKYILNEDERLMAIYLYLYASKEEISLFHLTEMLVVSRSTINDDLKKLTKYLEPHTLKLSYSRIKGYFIEGKEDAIRFGAMSIITKLVSDNRRKYIFELTLPEEGLSTFNRITSICKEKLRTTNISISDNNLLEVAYIATFVLIRNEEIEKSLFKEKNFIYEDHNEYDVAKSILQELGFDNREYIEFLTSLILSYSNGNFKSKTKDYLILNKFIGKIILKLEVSYGIKFSYKKEVCAQIYAHFRPAYYRIFFNYPVVNPLKNKIKRQYSVLFKILKDIFEPLSFPNNSTISDDEIAYLAIHFATLVDLDIADRTAALRAAIVCPNGIGISLLIYKELKTIFPEIQFLKPISLRELDIVVDEVDIIFSTKLIKTTKPIFIVSPIMNNIEKANLIKNFYMSRGKSVIEKDYVEDLLKVIKKYTVVKNLPELKKELSSMTSNYLYIDTERRQPMLSEIITSQLIQLNVVAVDWRDAIRKSAASLVANNKVTEHYVQAMIDSAEESGPYIVITKHVALPHARPEEGVKELAISITALKSPIEFGNRDNDPVKYVFCLSAIDNTTHLKALSELVELLGNNAFYSLLERAKDPNEIIEFIKKHEKEMSLL